MIRLKRDLKYISSFLLLLILFSHTNSFAQEAEDCDYCGKKITGRYIEAGGKHFHPRHFICFKCRRVITGAFVEKDERFYHPDCYAVREGLVCGYCKKLIKDEYMTIAGKKYHPDCYENHILPKCAVCGKPLEAEYIVDAFDNRYHSYHSREMAKCDNCNRVICERITHGGKIYSDGRNICSLCNENAVFDNARINNLYRKVIQKLRGFGLSFNENSIVVRGVDRRELKKVAGGRYDEHMRGICNTSSQTSYVNDRPTKTVKKHVISVLNGVPATNIESVIAHELMHVWMNDNTGDDHPDEIREGSCNYISYLYLKSVNSSEAQQIIRQLESDSSDEYGQGFLSVRSRFGNKSLSQLLAYLKRP